MSTALRSRVERILRGDIREQDLHYLFFNMREESGGRGIVSEIANFLAHPRLRTQGIATQEVRDMFAFLKFRLPLGHSRIITTALPPTVPDALRANLRRMRKSVLKDRTGLNPVRAKKLARMIPTGFGGLRKPVLLTQEEYAVFTLVGSYMKGGSFFTDDNLFNEFARVLQRQKLLNPSEMALLKKAKPAISLFAITTMHNRSIDLKRDDFSLNRLGIPKSGRV